MGEYRWRLRILGGVVLALTVGSVVQGCQQTRTNTVQSQETKRVGEDTRRLAECLQSYVNRTADAIDARTAAANDSALALDQLFEALLKAPPNEAGRAQVRAQFTDYVNARSRARQTQAEHPYPPPPRDLC